jgi:hypothetical protein
VEPLKLPELLVLADEECLTSWDELSLGYLSHVQGDPQLRTEIATKLYPNLFSDKNTDSAVSVSIENINRMAPQEGIFGVMHALSDCDGANRSKLSKDGSGRTHFFNSILKGCENSSPQWKKEEEDHHHHR